MLNQHQITCVKNFFFKIINVYTHNSLDKYYYSYSIDQETHQFKVFYSIGFYHKTINTWVRSNTNIQKTREDVNTVFKIQSNIQRSHYLLLLFTTTTTPNPMISTISLIFFFIFIQLLSLYACC